MRPQYEIDTFVILGIGIAVLAFGFPLAQLVGLVGYIVIGVGAAIFIWGGYRYIRLRLD